MRREGRRLRTECPKYRKGKVEMGGSLEDVFEGQRLARL
jgi:hypothetical protein